MNDPMTRFDVLCARYATALELLASHTSDLRKKVDAAKQQHIDDIRAAIRDAAVIRDEITEQLNANQPLFKKPKTRVLHDIKIGFRKQKGKLVISDAEKLIARLEKEYDGAEGHLVKTRKSVVKSGLEKLPGGELKRLGVTVEDATDIPVVDAVADDVDELIHTLFGDEL